MQCNRSGRPQHAVLYWPRAAGTGIEPFPSPKSTAPKLYRQSATWSAVRYPSTHPAANICWSSEASAEVTMVNLPQPSLPPMFGAPVTDPHAAPKHIVPLMPSRIATVCHWCIDDVTLQSINCKRRKPCLATDCKSRVYNIRSAATAIGCAFLGVQAGWVEQQLFGTYRLQHPSRHGKYTRQTVKSLPSLPPFLAAGRLHR